MDTALTHQLPSKEDIAQLPLFHNLAMERIQVIRERAQAELIREELFQTAVFGFDSESKPTFKVGEVSTGPHVIQLATLDKAYIFQMNAELWTFLIPLFASRDHIKVGFGLKNDAHLFRKKGIELNRVIELSTCFSAFGYHKTMGVKNAMALLFQVNFPKSKKISTSNWSHPQLSSAQIQYAAADAYACILIFEQLLNLGILPKTLLNPSLK